MRAHFDRPIRAAQLGCGYSGRAFQAPLIRASDATGLRLASSRDAAGVLPSPSGSHAPLARAALSGGKHVVVDKPFTVDPGSGFWCDLGPRLVTGGSPRFVVRRGRGGLAKGGPVIHGADGSTRIMSAAIGDQRAHDAAVAAALSAGDAATVPPCQASSVMAMTEAMLALARRAHVRTRRRPAAMGPHGPPRGRLGRDAATGTRAPAVAGRTRAMPPQAASKRREA